MSKKMKMVKDTFRKGGYKDKRSKNSRPLGTNRNNPTWYTLTPELGKLATAINMLTPNGANTKFADGVNLVNSSIAMPREPGVAANLVELVPGGVSTNPISALNEACRAMFTHIRSKLMKNISRYEKSDLFLMLYAVANIYGFIEYIKLVYRSLKKYNVLNKYTPVAILSAMGIDTSDVNNLGVQLKFYILKLIERVNKLVVPKIPLFIETIETFKHIYVDEDIAKAQYIVNVPMYFWKFVIDDTTGKGKLIPKQFYQFAANYDYTALVNYVEDLLYVLENDEDYAFMSGDILAAYPDIYKISSDDLDNPVEFEYSKEFLEKWHNSCQFGYTPANTEVSDWEITQATSSNLDDYLVFDPTFTASSVDQYTNVKRSVGNRYLDFYDREVTQDQIMVATRWMFSMTITDATNMKLKFRTIGTQVIAAVMLHYYDENGTLQWTNYNGYFSYSQNSTGYFASINHLRQNVLLRKWNYSPLTIVILTNTTVSGQNPGYLGLIGDLGNYTVIEPRILENINSLANYTVLGINPLLGS